MKVLLVAVMAQVALITGVTPAAAAEERVDLSNVTAIKAYLETKGIDTSNAIVQEGTNNYAGASCPGGSWTCANPTAGRPVIQRTSSGQNRYECGAAACVVVQTNQTGSNTATCTQKTGALVSCSITQHNAGGANTSSADQNTGASSGQTQNTAQKVDVLQQVAEGGTGSNGSTIAQRIFQSVDAVGPVTQSQFSSQKVALKQVSAAGSNGSALSQHLTQRANGSGVGVVQYQNHTGTEQYVQSQVDQRSDGGGANNSTLNARTDQQAVINAASGPITQQQGCEKCGVLASLNQSSTGVSTATETLTERQHLVANGASQKNQKQVGPLITPPDNLQPPGPANGVRCCSEQTGNPNNRFDIFIDSDQKGGPEIDQVNYVRGTCRTDGTCNVGLTVTQDGVTTSNQCSGQDCAIAVQCQDGQACQTEDNDEPETTLTLAPPAVTSSTSATFEFGSDESGGFICALDEGQWEACSSPKNYSDLAGGEHIFRVSAVDLAGNVDQTPAEATWTIDTAPPDTFIHSAPSGLTNQTTATIAFSASEPATFECKLDAGPWAACTSPAGLSGLADGTHTFGVRAADALGNVDPTPATASWTVDATVPASAFTTQNEATLCGDPPCAGAVLAKDKVTGTASDNLSGVDRVLVTFTSLTGPDRTFTATLTCNAGSTACTWEVDVPGVPPGRSRVTQRAFDVAGNEGPATSIDVTIV